MKKFLMLLSAVMLGLAVSSCEKTPEFPSGQGELVVTLAHIGPYGNHINVFPYTPQSPDANILPIASAKVYENEPTAHFTLNVGNYLVNYNQAVQIRDGETTEITVQ